MSGVILAEAVAILTQARNAYTKTTRMQTISGETDAERRASAGEARDYASEVMFGELGGLTFEHLEALLALSPPMTNDALEGVRDRLRAAVLRATADEVNGKPAGNIITKGCEAAEYLDPEDATGMFVDEIVEEVFAALSPPPTVGAEDEAVVWVRAGDLATLREDDEISGWGKPFVGAAPLFKRPAPAAVGQRVIEAIDRLRRWMPPSGQDEQIDADLQFASAVRASLASEKEG